MMIFWLYTIGATAGMVLLSAKLGEAYEEIARLHRQYDHEAQGVRDEAQAYAHGVTMSLTCLLAAMAAASWYSPRRGNGK